MAKQLFWAFIGSLCLSLTASAQSTPVNMDTATKIAIEAAVDADTSLSSEAPQDDTLVERGPKTAVAPALPFVTPKKKAMFSAMIPGLGQIYNRHYWKLPIVYGGLGAAGYFIYYNNSQYNYYREIYAGRLSNKPEFLNKDSHISTDNIKRLQDSWRSDRDMLGLVTALVYGLQVMDALVFAHLREFDISDDISFKIKPATLPTWQPLSPAVGVGLVFQFK